MSETMAACWQSLQSGTVPSFNSFCQLLQRKWVDVYTIWWFWHVRATLRTVTAIIGLTREQGGGGTCLAHHLSPIAGHFALPQLRGLFLWGHVSDMICSSGPKDIKPPDECSERCCNSPGTCPKTGNNFLFRAESCTAPKTRHLRSSAKYAVTSQKRKDMIPKYVNTNLEVHSICPQHDHRSEGKCFLVIRK